LAAQRKVFPELVARSKQAAAHKSAAAGSRLSAAAAVVGGSIGGLEL